MVTIDIQKDGKNYILEWRDLKNGGTTISITECCQYPDEIEMLETYDFNEI